MNRRKIIFYVIVAIVAVMGVFALFMATNNMIEFSETAPPKDDPVMLQEGYETVAKGANQDQVLALMGTHETVEACPPPPTAAGDDTGPVCAHVYHYQAGDQAWDFTFDVDGNLMSKRIGSVQ